MDDPHSPQWNPFIHHSRAEVPCNSGARYVLYGRNFHCLFCGRELYRSGVWRERETGLLSEVCIEGRCGGGAENTTTNRLMSRTEPKFRNRSRRRPSSLTKIYIHLHYGGKTAL